MFLRDCGGDEHYQAEKSKLCGMGNSIKMLSSYQCKTEPHEWLYLVLFHRWSMANHGVKALDESVVGRCHVAKSREPCISISSSNRKLPLKASLTLPDNRTCSCNHRVAYLSRRVNQRQRHKYTWYIPMRGYRAILS